ncbi:uncharacterized protein LOC128558233 [Mercenaria mercenaria]|uniref:uncharacterized protein LOC128558233 n=1 Tax=Mercenaria mercenaria TaxID=6596 RepID=UPI00234E90F6|nr:uncharacterized protein LOC128558233 [Mercenaria mercenaria]
MAAHPKEPMGKHFQNDQRRHNENEAESHVKRGSVRTEHTEIEDEEDLLGAVGGQGRQHTASSRSPVDTFGQPTGRLLSPVEMPSQNNGQIVMNEVSHLGLPEPAGMNRQFLIDLQQIPEHLRRQLIFNYWPHQRTGVTDGVASEERQYQIEQKKHAARLILTHISDELRLQMGEKEIDRILEGLVAVHVIYGVASSACYGTDASCDFYTMQCASQQVVRVRNLYAGYKNTTLYPVCGTEQHCSSSSTCCALGGTDIREDFNLENTYNTYTNCSGRQSCTAIHAPWQQLQTTVNGFTIYSSFVQLEYDCQEVSSKIPLCGGSSITSYAEIMFDGSMENFDHLKASKECRCNVTNFGEQQNVIFTTIDVRLESHYKRENQTSADCSSASFSSYVRSAKCVESDRHYADNFFYESSDNSQQTRIMAPWMTSEIRLTDIHANGIRDSPAIVWLSLKAEEGKAFSVTCEEVIPAQFTTTTTTFTTTKSTSVTTKITAPTQRTAITTTTSKPTITTMTFTSKQTTRTAANTTPKPMTTSMTTTSKPTTKSITTSTSVSFTSTSFQTTLKPTVELTPSYSPQTTPATGNRDSDRTESSSVTMALAIGLPAIVCLLVITSVLLFLNLRRISSSREQKPITNDTSLPHVYDYINEVNINPNTSIVLQRINPGSISEVLMESALYIKAELTLILKS